MLIAIYICAFEYIYSLSFRSHINPDQFPLLSHLFHMTLLNIPLYLFKSLHYMVGFVRSSRQPLASLTHHGLVELLMLRALTQQN